MPMPTRHEGPDGGDSTAESDRAVVAEGNPKVRVVPPQVGEAVVVRPVSDIERQTVNGLEMTLVMLLAVVLVLVVAVRTFHRRPSCGSVSLGRTRAWACPVGADG